MQAAQLEQLLTLVSQLGANSGRRECARQLAAYMGNEDLMVFINDSEIGQLLPAPGFPQTLPGTKAWRGFLQECSKTPLAFTTAQLLWPGQGNIKTVSGFLGTDGSVLVLLGTPPDPDLVLSPVETVRLLLPLLSAAFQGEQQALYAGTQARLARETALQTGLLNKALDTARRDLQAALQTRDEFLAIAAHELRTPLTSITGYTQLLHRRLANSTTLAQTDIKSLAAIKNQAQRLTKLIEDLFNISRINSGKLSLELVPLDLCRLAQRLCTEMQPLLQSHVLVVSCEVEGLQIEGDEPRLEQVLNNLLQNAVKYSPHGTQITLRLLQAGSQAVIEVSDQGPGIALAAQSQLFQRFYRVKSQQTHHIEGLGIGLYLVKELVERHHGTVEVISDEGSGSTFRIRLPLLPAVPTGMNPK